MEVSIKEGSPRSLLVNAVPVATGGSNRAGLYAAGRLLYLDGAVIAESTGLNIGLYPKGEVLMFNNVEVGNNPPEPDTFWTPPVQKAAVNDSTSPVLRNWTYAEYIAMYDGLQAKASTIDPAYVITKEVSGEYKAENGEALYRYIFQPESYNQTIMILGGTHGNEDTGKLACARIAQILAYDYKNAGYTAWQEAHSTVRFIIIPIVNPSGHVSRSMLTSINKYNLNRCMDYSFTPQAVGNEKNCLDLNNYAPFEPEECKWVRDTVLQYKDELNFFCDFHDGGGIEQHFWIGYNPMSPMAGITQELVLYLCEKYIPAGEEWIIPNCKDSTSFGTNSSYCNKSLGITANTCEFIGGLLGYDFSSFHMTLAMDIYGNNILNAVKSNYPVRKTDSTAVLFHFSFPFAATKTSRQVSTYLTATDAERWREWDSLTALSKSNSFGVSDNGNDVRTYTFGTGANKVFITSTHLYPGQSPKRAEIGMWMFAYYLCSDIEDDFLAWVRGNCTIVFLPFIDRDGIGNVPLEAANHFNSSTYDMNTGFTCTSIMNNVLNSLGGTGLSIVANERGSYNNSSYESDYDTNIFIPVDTSYPYIDDFVDSMKAYDEYIYAGQIEGGNLLNYLKQVRGFDTVYIDNYIARALRENLLEIHTTYTKPAWWSLNYEMGRYVALFTNIIYKRFN